MNGADLNGGASWGSPVRSTAAWGSLAKGGVSWARPQRLPLAGRKAA